MICTWIHREYDSRINLNLKQRHLMDRKDIEIRIKLIERLINEQLFEEFDRSQLEEALI